jgi:hypothetical protein
MKTLARILSFYFLFLITVPTIKVVKSQLGRNCAESCQKEMKGATPKGCQKGKCILNFNFNTGQFIVQQIQSVSFNSAFEIVEKGSLSYEKVFIDNYKNTIWHPPKSDSFA